MLTSRPVRFLLAGGACYLLNLLVLYFCVASLGLHYTVGTAVSFVVVAVFGHFLNRRLTFRSSAAYPAELARYAATVAAQALAGLGLVIVFVERGGIPYLWANLLAAALLTSVSYLLQRAWVFGRSRAGTPP
jgi:putative flippase GtrA